MRTSTTPVDWRTIPRCAVVDRDGLYRAAASTSQLGRFETPWLTSEANLAALVDLFGAWIDRVHARRPQSSVVLDMDSSVSETHGAQEGSAYNGHFACTCYQPLFVFSQFGDLERCALRPRNVHSADGWREVLEPVVARYRNKMRRRFFRGDAGYANPDIYEYLEAEGYKGGFNWSSQHHDGGRCDGGSATFGSSTAG
jgi:hypothetical protein